MGRAWETSRPARGRPTQSLQERSHFGDVRWPGSTLAGRTASFNRSSPSRRDGLFDRRMIERLLHARLDAFLRQRLLVFLAQERILQPVRDGGPALRHVDRALVGVLLARHAGLVLAMIVGAVPADQAQRLLADAEMGMEPVPAVGRGGDDADWLVILPVDVVRLAVLPRRHAFGPWPR